MDVNIPKSRLLWKENHKANTAHILMFSHQHYELVHFLAVLFLYWSCVGAQQVSHQTPITQLTASTFSNPHDDPQWAPFTLLPCATGNNNNVLLDLICQVVFTVLLHWIFKGTVKIKQMAGLLPQESDNLLPLMTAERILLNECWNNDRAQTWLLFQRKE